MWINVAGVRINLNNVIAYRDDREPGFTEMETVDRGTIVVNCKPEQIDGFIRLMSMSSVMTVEEYEERMKIREWVPTTPAPGPSDGE